MKLEQLMKDWNKDSKALVAVQGLEREALPRIPFSAPSMNYQTYGGLPRKRVVEFFGPESSGKTTSALDIVKNAQMVFEQEWEQKTEELKEKLENARASKASKTAVKELEMQLDSLQEPLKIVYLDLENTLDTEWAKKIGVDVDNIWIVRPEMNSAEEILQYVLDIFETGEVGLVVLDSLPYMVSQNLIDEELTKKAYAGISAPLTEFSRKVTPLLTRYNAIFLGINQIREDMNSQYNAYSTPGGKMWKHACAVRLKFRKGDYLDENGASLTRTARNPAGNVVESFVEKTKAFKPDRKLVSYTLSYHDGIQIENDLVDVAVEFGVIQKAGAWFSIVDLETGEIMTDEDEEPLKFQGKANLVRRFKEDDYLFDMVMTAVHEIITREEG
ncbi:RecA [Streptococcus phage Dp-1]|uniref:UvsX-like recombinase n=1 Tax=Pneumococcus phage Dp-1 TaxID=59241 RepID=UPI0001F3E620|nr:UvsX-like recombinase [Streptococcus phage Dp-1]ADT64022.1 RecA [Streptococcus phage Dp-1]